MLDNIYSNIQSHNVDVKSHILCAISGGIDSTVMLHVLNDYGFECIVAHCNFQLRGKESDDDQKFVKELAEKLDLQFFTINFETQKYAANLGLSIQMAARELRYQWFNELKEKLNCDYIALAHNSDDQIETIITNLIRGTGIRGLTGMEFLKNDFFRPLIFVSRNEIEKYAQENNIKYRNDSTNATVKYSRNKIRHQIIPLLEEINPAAKKNILRSNKFLKDTEEILYDYVRFAKEKCLYFKDNNLVIDINELLKFKAPRTVLFELLVQNNIPKVLASESLNLINAPTGRFCSFATYRILKNRGELIVSNLKKVPNLKHFIYRDSYIQDFAKVNIQANIVNVKEIVNFKHNNNIAYLDFDKITFPLLIRRWEKGDKFKPFGMNNFKKLSDFFTDLKLNIFDKEKISILCSGNDIIWIIGYRTDNRYKVDDNTQKVLILEKTK